MVRSKYNPYATPEALERAYRETGSIRILAKQCDVSPGTLRMWLKSAGIERKGPGGPNNPRGARKSGPVPQNPFNSTKQAQACYNALGSENAVAREYGVAQRTAQVWLNRWEVKRFPRGNRPKGMTTPNMGDEA